MPQILDAMPGVTVGDAAVVKLVDNTLSARRKTIRSVAGSNPVWLSRNPQVAPDGADAWELDATVAQSVDLAPGEALYAICAAGQTADVQVI